MDACNATSNMSEKDDYEEVSWYKDNSDEEFDDLKEYKIGSVILVDSGAAFTLVNKSIELQCNTVLQA